MKRIREIAIPLLIFVGFFALPAFVIASVHI